MGGAALGADVTDGPAPIVPGSLGVFGGTFDPIHVAHLAVAQEAAEAAGLERVVFIPAGEPPHKPGLVATPAEQRLAMVELAIAGNPRFAVDRREIDRAGPSYTVDTLEALHAEAVAADRTPDVRLILSAEAFLELMTWREPRRVVELARVVVAPRDGYPAAGPGVPRAPPARPRRSGDLPRRATDAAVGQRASTARRERAIAALPRPGCGRGVYRRPWAVPEPSEDPIDVTEPVACQARDLAAGRRPAQASGIEAAPAGSRRSSLRAASSSSPRTRRPPTSCCSTSPG